METIEKYLDNLALRAHQGDPTDRPRPDNRGIGFGELRAMKAPHRGA
jgi:hypothetical protein